MSTTYNMQSVTSNAVYNALGGKLNNTKTLLHTGIMTSGVVNNLNDNIRNYNYILIEFQTNIEYDFMLLPVSNIVSNANFIRTAMANETEVVILPFQYQSMCIVTFPTDTTIKNKIYYNNVNWQLKVVHVWGIK